LDVSTLGSSAIRSGIVMIVAEIDLDFVEGRGNVFGRVGLTLLDQARQAGV
jgi:hypothetical protein